MVGSLLTFEGTTSRGVVGYDRTVMLAGGVGFTATSWAQKRSLQAGDVLVLLGGDNYRIGMAGGSVSSVGSGEVAAALELSAVQRANPEMQKRVYNVIRALCERQQNPIKSIHDHGAGGHLNCFSELIDPVGGRIDAAALPVGDSTLSFRELLSNESQERMGLAVAPDALRDLQELAERERAPMYIVGEITGDERILVTAPEGQPPVDLPLSVLFGSAPQTTLVDETVPLEASAVALGVDSPEALRKLIDDVLRLESVACKDWLTNKVDRCVTGRVALQQCAGPYQLPINNLGIAALDYCSNKGIASSIGHAPVAALIDERAGAVLSVAEALTNIIWAPLEHGIESVALSANWMWPAKQPGEDVRLYNAVAALSEFCVSLGIAVPTGKDSLSMTMRYDDGSAVRAPGTVIVSGCAVVADIRRVVTPDLKPELDSVLLHIDLSGDERFPLGGSAAAQVRSQLGSRTPTVADAERFKRGLQAVQSCITQGLVLAGHDISSGGLGTALIEMAVTGDFGLRVQLDGERAVDALFCEKPGVVLQVRTADIPAVVAAFESLPLEPQRVARLAAEKVVELNVGSISLTRSVADLRRVWFETS
ncbi:MAG: hypothetical protein KDD44_08620, partial [Bdellovibrionales bacterium]|nr:hypothetical protein [Bdellovibrionales bacterium]